LKKTCFECGAVIEEGLPDPIGWTGSKEPETSAACEKCLPIVKARWEAEIEMLEREEAMGRQISIVETKVARMGNEVFRGLPVVRKAGLERTLKALKALDEEHAGKARMDIGGVEQGVLIVRVDLPGGDELEVKLIGEQDHLGWLVQRMARG